MRPYLIAIAGPSGSGKSELARNLAATLDAPILSMNVYYNDAAHLSMDQRVRLNFDDPSSLDQELLTQHIRSLVRGEEIAAPVYDFRNYVRESRTVPMRATKFAIVQGLFALYWQNLCELAGTKVYVDAPDEICLGRRMERDVCDRGRTAESVIEQFATTVKPMAQLYVSPTRGYADVVVSGAQPVELSAQAVLAHVAEHLPKTASATK